MNEYPYQVWEGIEVTCRTRDYVSASFIASYRSKFAKATVTVRHHGRTVATVNRFGACIYA